MDQANTTLPSPPSPTSPSPNSPSPLDKLLLSHPQSCKCHCHSTKSHNEELPISDGEGYLNLLAFVLVVLLFYFVWYIYTPHWGDYGYGHAKGV